MLGGVLGMAMVMNMFVAATTGTLIPIGLRAMKIDPAIAFFGLGTLFLRYLPHAG